jgi:hypothetical protein
MFVTNTILKINFQTSISIKACNYTIITVHVHEKKPDDVLGVNQNISDFEQN